MTNIVTSNEIIAVANRKNILNEIIEKEIFACKSKISFFCCIWWTKSFNVLGGVIYLESNSGCTKQIGKVCS